MLAAMLIFATLPSGLDDCVVRDSVDVIEVNHCYRVHCGQLDRCYSQVIFWVDEWFIGERGPEVRQVCAKYIMFNGVSDLRLGVHEVRWREGPRHIVVEASQMLETHTMCKFDPEILDREVVKPKWRRGIVGVDPLPEPAEAE